MRRCLLLLLAISNLASAGMSASDSSSTGSVRLNGLPVEIRPNGLLVHAGEGRIEGRAIKVKASVEIEVAAPPPLEVRKEKYRKVSSVLPERWGPGTHLRQTLSGGTSLPGALVPGSVVVELADGTRLEEGRDYDVNTKWAAIARRPDGRITTEAEVLVSYQVGQMSLDLLAVSPETGRVEYVQGAPSKDTPEVPAPPAGMLALARIFRPYHTTQIESWHLFEAGPPFPEPSAEEIRRRASQIPRTLDKLRRGEAVTIVTWGDSVTVGADASSPEKGYAQLFIQRLRERFPQAKITHFKEAIGGSNTDHRLPSLQKEVLDHRPDLVTIEFVNDMPFDEAHYRKNYDQALTRIQGAGAEVILITPHFTMPEMMGHPYPRGKETRPAVSWLRDIAKARNLGLADTSRRWEHLETEGLPYLIFLKNGINHPDDRGHELFVRDLMTFFPAQ